jgi:hypothetical protein
MVTPSPGRNWMGVLSWFFLCNEGLLSFVSKKEKKKRMTVTSFLFDIFVLFIVYLRLVDQGWAPYFANALA